MLIEQFLEEHTDPLKQTTLCFLMKDHQICLATKKVPAKKDKPNNYLKLNGYGGDVEEGETTKKAVAREVLEETSSRGKNGVVLLNSRHSADLKFYFLDRPEISRHGAVYVSTLWKGIPHESQEMSQPEWHPVSNIPFDRMWPTDRYWLPQVLEGKFINGEFLLTTKDELLEAIINGEQINVG